jgi:toxin ParE1/3/4
MQSVIKSPEAEEDLIDIWLYIAGDSPANADRFLDRLEGMAQKLAHMPGMGKDRLELAPALKSFPMDDYVVFYRMTLGGIELVRVLRCSRDVSLIFQ